MQRQYGEKVASAIHTGVESFKTKSDAELTSLDDMATKALYLGASYFAARWDWLQLMPAPLMGYQSVRNAIKYFAKDDIVKEANRILYSILILTILCTLTLGSYGGPCLYIIPLLWLFSLTLASQIYSFVETQALNEITRRTKIMYPMLEKFKNDNYKYILGLSALAFSVMAIRCVYKSYMAIKPSQGNIVSPDETEVKKRDTETNPYVDVYRRPLPIEGKGRTMTPSDMSNRIKSNLLYGSVKMGDKVMKVNALMVRTNYMLIPKHYFASGSTVMTARRNNPDSSGGNYRVRLDLDMARPLPDSDLMLVYVAEGGSFHSLVDLLIDKMPVTHCFNMIYRQYDGTFLNARGLANPNLKCNTGEVFKGMEYHNLSMNTFGGLCGAVLYSNGPGCNITGIHVGGVEEKPIGCSSIPLRHEIKSLMEEIHLKINTVKMADDSDFPTKQFGKEFLLSDELHPKSPMNYLPKGSTINYHGSCIGKTTSHSDAKVTPISAKVTEITGVANKWQGPEMKPEWKGWQDCLANMSIPGISMPYNLIEKCAQDYIAPLKELMEEHIFWKSMRPLTDEENLLGIPGQKFMDAIKKNTSIGYPLTGSKMKHLEELEATDKYPHNFRFSTEIMEEINKAEEKYAAGKRAYPIAKACKKDEILGKKKCRIFYGNAIQLTWLIRKYYLPLIRFLQMNPLVSECAVGINCHSEEWEQLHKFVTKFKNLIGGDYKKYDQKLPVQILICAFRILIELAKLCDYSEKDITIMESLVSDVVYAYIAFNGDLVSLTSGTHISGNSLTVILNGICGSLNLRAAFYTHNDWSLKFRDYVALSTYGDDNQGSTEGCKFNIKLIAEFLDQYGQTYTMPNKSDEISEYLDPEDFEFLKRKSVYIPEIGIHVGALQSDSIYKSLHMFLRGKNCENSVEEACALNVDTAVREFFNHGREVYEEQRALLRRIAKESGIDSFCTELHIPFDERVNMWRYRYDPAFADQSSNMTEKGSPRMTHGVAEAVEDVPAVLVTNQEE